MENGEVGCDGGGELERKLASFALTNDFHGSVNTNDGLFQVMKAVEAAEVTIKQQVEENDRLRSELQKKSLELEKYKSNNLGTQNPRSIGNLDDSIHEPQTARQSSPSANQTVGCSGIEYSHDPSGAVAKELVGNIEDPLLQSHGVEYKKNKIHGPDNIHPSQLSSPSSSSISLSRYHIEGEWDSRFSISGQGPMQMSEADNSVSILKQDLVAKIREREELILQLRKHLTEYSIKEAQICNEKYVLEKRIAYMRMAFDQQQQDLVDAASKAISYRQDIIEKNIHLTYALQDAQEERSTFISSLMPLLSEYSLQPPVADAQSIVSNLKILFKHLQEKLILTEAKLKESEYQLAPLHSDANPSSFASSPLHSRQNKDGLELVPQPTYSNGQMPVSSNPLTTRSWDLLDNHQSGSDVGVKYPPIASRSIESQKLLAHVEPHPLKGNVDTPAKQVTFIDQVSSRGMDDPDLVEPPSTRVSEIKWAVKNAAYAMQDDPSSSFSPHLTPVLEEPSSSFSDAADDDPLPAIEGLQISGEAFPGFELQVSGYSINGTTSCNFEWVRHLEDGSVSYIEGAKQPNYLITADDVGTYLAIEVQPLDDRMRKGSLVKVFANEHKKITCDVDIQSCIEKTLNRGHASYQVSLAVGYLDIWEAATLAINRGGYSIKCSETIINDKFSPSTLVTIPYGNPTEFSIVGSGGTERYFRTDNSVDIACSRDTIVLTLRLFIVRSGEKRKGKRALFFKKLNDIL